MSTIWKQAAGTALGVLIGLGMGAMMYAKAIPKQQALPQVVIRAQRFEVVDEQGKVVGGFGIEANSKDASIKHDDFNRKLGVSGTPVGLYLMPQGPKGMTVALTAHPDGEGGFFVVGYNAKKNERTTVVLGNIDNTPALRLAIDGEHHHKQARTLKP